MVHITRGLAETLLRFGEERAPESVTIALSVVEATELDGSTLSDEVPVFSHFYLPNAGDSVTAVFGVDLGTPVGQTAGRFVSHPDGTLGVSLTDDLHEVVFVGVPPWELSDLAAFDRSGTRRDLTIVEAEPPEESL
ncbi:MAG: hypothetical protein ABEJ30_01400 [Halorientalis sp.]